MTDKEPNFILKDAPKDIPKNEERNENPHFTKDEVNLKSESEMIAHHPIYEENQSKSHTKFQKFIWKFKHFVSKLKQK